MKIDYRASHNEFTISNISPDEMEFVVQALRYSRIKSADLTYEVGRINGFTSEAYTSIVDAQKKLSDITEGFEVAWADTHDLRTRVSLALAITGESVSE